MMKKTTSLDMFGPTCSFSFLHLTQAPGIPVSSLFMSLELRCGLQVHLFVRGKYIVNRFLAGLCAHGNDIVYQTLGGLLRVNDLNIL